MTNASSVKAKTRERAWGEGDYIFRLCDGLVIDAQNSTHFSRFFNHAEHGCIYANVSAAAYALCISMSCVLCGAYFILLRGFHVMYFFLK